MERDFFFINSGVASADAAIHCLLLDSMISMDLTRLGIVSVSASRTRVVDCGQFEPMDDPARSPGRLQPGSAEEADDQIAQRFASDWEPAQFDRAAASGFTTVKPQRQGSSGRGMTARVTIGRGCSAS
jgi:hypothetical protein